MEKGDYTQLARDYSRYRPSYNKEVVRILINATEKPAARLIVADVGAGTGIFTSCMIGAGVKNIVAVEPNLNMREAGRENLKNKVEFIDGSAESTSLGSKKYDLVTMASSFHWPKTNDALKEFDRILSNKGVFTALWNPRLTDRSRAETEVQRLLAEKYKITSRVSSGLSGITDSLTDTLSKCGYFRSVVYVDAVDVVTRTHEQYIGAWRSVNDIQATLGRKKFSIFLNETQNIIEKFPHVDVHYLTRAWIAFK